MMRAARGARDDVVDVKEDEVEFLNAVADRAPAVVVGWRAELEPAVSTREVVADENEGAERSVTATPCRI